MPRFMTRTIKPVGLCPRCKRVPRVPGTAYCADCMQVRNREELARYHRATPGAPASATPPAPPD